MIRLPAFAKVNLHLQVVGRRGDGYHELRTVFQTIDLADELEVEIGGDGVTLEVPGAGAPAGAENLAFRAAEAFLQRWAPGTGCHLRLTKRIPAGAGLGGGSSDAAATLLALQRLLATPAPPGELWEVARGLGADVPYFLTGGTALGVGRGDEVTALPDLPERELWLVLPPLEISTREVFAGLGDLTAAPLAPRIGASVQAGKLGWGVLAAGANDLEVVVFERWPLVRRAHRALGEAGATLARLSGSGTALFALFDEQPSPRALRERLPAGCRLERVRTLGRRRLAERLAGRAAADT